MNLRDYLINCIIEEKDIINELLYIDNKIQYTHLNYEELVDKLNNVSKINLDNDLNFVALTDGEVETVFKVLISVSKLDIIYVDKKSLGINKYLVSRANMFYENNNIQLDITDDYRKYLSSEYSIIISGFDTFVEELSKEFRNKDITIL